MRCWPRSSKAPTPRPPRPTARPRCTGLFTTTTPRSFGASLPRARTLSAVNRYGASVMSEAATLANATVIEQLLDAGADVESRGADGQTALMIVARTNRTDAATLLLARGADVNARESWRGQTALMWAAAQRQPAMVRALIEHGADVDARSTPNEWPRQVTGEPRRMYRPFAGLTPLLFAAREGCLDCARALVDAGANIDLADPKNVTPLFLAIDNLHFDLAKYLIEAGANPNKWDWWGRTPLYSAVDVNTLPHGGRPDRPSTDADDRPRHRQRFARSRCKSERSAQALPAVATHRRRSRLRFDADDRRDAAAARRENVRRRRDAVAHRARREARAAQRRRHHAAHGGGGLRLRRVRSARLRPRNPALSCRRRRGEIDRGRDGAPRRGRKHSCTHDVGRSGIARGGPDGALRRSVLGLERGRQTTSSRPGRGSTLPMQPTSRPSMPRAARQAVMAAGRPSRCSKTPRSCSRSSAARQPAATSRTLRNPHSPRRTKSRSLAWNDGKQPTERLPSRDLTHVRNRYRVRYY